MHARHRSATVGSLVDAIPAAARSERPGPLLADLIVNDGGDDGWSGATDGAEPTEDHGPVD